MVVTTPIGVSPCRLQNPSNNSQIRRRSPIRLECDRGTVLMLMPTRHEKWKDFKADNFWKVFVAEHLAAALTLTAIAMLCEYSIRSLSARSPT